jgi:hypothetical protein
MSFLRQERPLLPLVGRLLARWQQPGRDDRRSHELGYLRFTRGGVAALMSSSDRQ